jgi:hypothetical protein
MRTIFDACEDLIREMKGEPPIEREEEYWSYSANGRPKNKKSKGRKKRLD